MTPQEGPVTVVLGASPLPERHAHMAVLRLRAAGHQVVAVGRRTGNIGDVPIRQEWPAGVAVDTVTIYMNSVNQAPWMRVILDAHPRRIIFNPGAEHPAFAAQAAQAGINALDACTLVMLATGQY